MDEMTIEYVYGTTLHKAETLAKDSQDYMVPVVRLSAVDTLLAEAVWAMEFVAGQVAPWGQHGQRAQAFLSSPAVLDYLARVAQKENNT